MEHWVMVAILKPNLAKEEMNNMSRVGHKLEKNLGLQEFFLFSVIG